LTLKKKWGKNTNEQCILQNFVIKVKKKISNFSINQLTLERYIHVHLGMQKREKIWKCTLYKSCL